MAGRTFAIGDIHGERAHLARIWSLLPLLDAGDTVVFLGDYVNRGPHSKEVVETLMALPDIDEGASGVPARESRGRLVAGAGGRLG